ncbi:hypothetical protein OU789_02615 [Halocynthiibacter sp. C4]|uniref:hypothetical protein n=1 Tax=Halocynthiibacter sp. C4 TaxID=2992758 RepID=UPI00237A4F88|nr:hypothetical protein [Halocynthiibacter sp. C4]MDE0588815.1 hypothetical protein [Halocynthiibacter sp. C4]
MPHVPDNLRVDGRFPVNFNKNIHRQKFKEFTIHVYDHTDHVVHKEILTIGDGIDTAPETQKEFRTRCVERLRQLREGEFELTTDEDDTGDGDGT